MKEEVYLLIGFLLLVVFIVGPIVGVFVIRSKMREKKHNWLTGVGGICILLAIPVMFIGTPLATAAGSATIAHVLQVIAAGLLFGGGIVGGIGMVIARWRSR